jgi:hypothetical protein
MAPWPMVGGCPRIRCEHRPTPGAQMLFFTLKAADDLADVWNLTPTQFENVAGARHLLILRAAILLRTGARGRGQYENQNRRSPNAEPLRDGRQ